MKKNALALSLLSLLALLCSCAAATVKVTAPESGAAVPVLSAAQKAWIERPRAERVESFASISERKEMAALGFYPQEITLSWKADGEFAAAEVEIQERTAAGTLLPAPYLRVMAQDAASAVITNLKIATAYEWTVTLKDAAGKVVATDTGSFTTEENPPRLVRIDGVPNVRDLGGRIGLDGRRVKQGLIYRTAGLNDNAGPAYMSEEESGNINVEKKAAQKAVIAYWQERAKHQDEPLVPYSLSENWTLFLLEKGDIPVREDDPELDKVTAIPADYRGVAGQTVVVDPVKGWLTKAQESRPAVLMQEFEAPADGYMRISCGADWFFSVRINGEKVFDCLPSGSTKGMVDVSNYPLDLKVRQGRNLIVVHVQSGSSTHAWVCGKAAERIKSEWLVEQTSQEAKNILVSVSRVVKGMQAGRNRLSEEMKRYVVQDLGVKSDIDLRSDGECYGMTESPAGPEVKWWHYPSSAYRAMASANGKAAFTKVFRVFLDEQNYPVIFHCIAGQDRTGAVAFILNGLLGVDEEELYRDWEVTGFWNSNPAFCHRFLFNYLVLVFKDYPGETINQRIENYVLSLGFTPEEIEHFRQIMLEE